MNFDKDYYGILGVLPSAEDFLIKAAYKVIAQKYHPDKFKESKQQAKAEVKMKAVNEAYAILSDAKKRKQYDDYLKQNNRQNEYHEEEPVESGSSELVNENDWLMAVEYVPELKELYNNLKVISPNLAFNFKLYVLRDKAFDKAKKVSIELETAFFTTFFGNDANITIFAKYLLENNHRDAAQELNKAVKFFESKVEADKIINNICLKYKINNTHKRDDSPIKEDAVNYYSTFTDTFVAGSGCVGLIFRFSMLLAAFVFIFNLAR